MATTVDEYFAVPRTTLVLGDKLQQPSFFTVDTNDNVVSYTGFTLTAKLFDSRGNLVASPAVATSDADPLGTGVVTDSLISVSEIPANLPSRQGKYTLQIIKTNDSDATDIQTVLINVIQIVHPYAIG